MRKRESSDEIRWSIFMQGRLPLAWVWQCQPVLSNLLLVPANAKTTAAYLIN
jgi:hypothetical protein